MNASPALIDRLRDPGEKAAYIWLCLLSVPAYVFVAFWVVMSYGAALFLIGLFFLIKFLGELFAAAYIKTNAIEVSEWQLPEVYAAVMNCSQRLGCTLPTVYVMQESMWNAFATQLAGKNLIVLFSGAIDSILLKGDMRQVSFVVGHEIGHVAAGHLSFWRRAMEAGGWLPWLLLWYRRRGEITCDRVALYCSGDLRSTLLAVANLTVGAQLAERVNIDQAIAQWNKHRDEVYVRYRTIYSTHPPNLWRMEEILKAAAAMGLFATQPPAPAATVGDGAPVG